MWLSSCFGFASALSLSSVSIDHHDLGQNASRTVQTADGNFGKTWIFSTPPSRQKSGNLEIMGDTSSITSGKAVLSFSFFYKNQ